MNLDKGPISKNSHKQTPLLFLLFFNKPNKKKKKLFFTTGRD